MTCHNCEAKAKRHGKDRKGVQRYRCNTCQKTFTEYQEKPLDGMYLPLEKAVTILSMLLEGMSIRSVQRITGVEKKTIVKLLVQAGEKSERLLNDKLKGLSVRDVQADELWGFVAMKNRTKHQNKVESEELGTCYTWVAMETHSKLVLAWHLGKRTSSDCVEFTEKLNEATTGRFQLSTDAYPAYADAVCYSLGTRVDYAQLTKIYESGKETKVTAKRYSPTKFIKAIPTPIWGQPNMEKLCTSHIERLNLSLRMALRRLTRLTNAFSKKWYNLKCALALYFAYYNFVRTHQTLRCTPAMAHGITKSFWTLEDLLKY
jgi:transposase-like protein/IS1 family transposase